MWFDAVDKIKQAGLADDFMKYVQSPEVRKKDEQFGNALKMVAEECTKNENMLDYVRRIQYEVDNNINPGEYPLDTPAMVLGQRQLVIYATANKDYGIPDQKGLSNVWRFQLTEWLRQSVPYVWTPEMLDLAMDANLPEHIVGKDQMPFDMMWMTSPTTKLRMDNKAAEHILLVNLKGENGIEGIAVNVFCSPVDEANGKPGPGDAEIYSWSMRYGQRYPQDFENDEAKMSTAKMILGMLSFINSPFVEKTIKGLSRNERRRFGMKFPIDDSTQVRFIDLRHPVKVDMNREANQTEVNWQYRWLVQGHYKAQWYPSIQAHKVIWIRPYEKGPEDAPLKTSVRRVIR